MLVTKVLPTWRLSQLADGVALTPPEGPQQGAIRIREGQRPLLSAANVFLRAAEKLPAAKLDLGTVERMITNEGEYGAIQIQKGTGNDGASFLRALGVVFGDDTFTFVDSATTIPERFAFFEQAVRTFTFYVALGLGHRRRRRFEYTPPKEWGGVARELDGVWMAPGFPRARAMITVHAAEPADGPPAMIRDAILARLGRSGLASVEVGETERRFTRAELSGVGWRARGTDGGTVANVDIVVLEDDRFFYPLELMSVDSQLDEARRAFDAVVSSARAIPLPEAQPLVDSTLHWAT